MATVTNGKLDLAAIANILNDDAVKSKQADSEYVKTVQNVLTEAGTYVLDAILSDKGKGSEGGIMRGYTLAANDANIVLGTATMPREHAVKTGLLSADSEPKNCKSFVFTYFLRHKTVADTLETARDAAQREYAKVEKDDTATPKQKEAAKAAHTAAILAHKTALAAEKLAEKNFNAAKEAAAKTPNDANNAALKAAESALNATMYPDGMPWLDSVEPSADTVAA